MLVSPAMAQDYTNVTASGRVLGADGSAIVGATVQVASTDRGFTRSASTDGSGSFKFPQLAPGAYTITVSAAGFETYTEPGVQLTQASAANQFTLKPVGGDAVEGIVVTAGRKQVADFEKTTTGAVINIGDLAQRVPVSRSLRDIILLAPGTVQGSASHNGAFANQATISGAAFTENAYYLNGLNITDFRMGFSPVAVPFDFYQTVEVKTGGFQAEFGRATGGVVNATTKSGSNAFHGSVTGTWEPNGLRSASPNTYAADNDGAFVENRETVYQLSGPLIKDHLFFYGLYNTRDMRSINANQGNTDPTKNTADEQINRSPFWGGKLDAIVVDGQHLEFTYFDTTSITRTNTYAYNSDTDALGAVQGGNNQRSGGKNYVGRYTGTFAPWITVSAAYGVNKSTGGTLPLDTSHEKVLDNRSGQSVDIGLNKVDSVSFNDDKREFYRGDVDLYFSALGSHHVRFGYDHELDTATQFFHTMGGGAYYYYRVTDPTTDITHLPTGTEYMVTRVYSNSGAFQAVNQAFYIQDNWSLMNDRLTLQLGLRNDKFDNRDAGGQSFYTSGNQWGPRLGFTFDPTGDGDTKIYGSFGRYFLPVAVNTNLSLAGAVLTFNRYNLLNGINPGSNTPIQGAPISTVEGNSPCPDTGVANCTISRDGSVSNPTSFIARNLKPQSEDEFIIGAERRVTSRIKVGAYYTQRKLNHVLEDAAIDLGAIDYCTGKGFAAADCKKIFSGGSQFVLINPGEDAVVKLIGMPDGSTPTVRLTADQLRYPKAERNFKSMTFTVDREFDGVWSLSGSYTWASTRGNYEGGVKSDVGQAATGITADFDSPGFTIGSYGTLPNSRAHTFKAYGSFQVTDWLQLGANAVVQSPRKYGCIGVVPADIDTVAHGYGGYGFFCQGKSVPRASAFESDWRKQLDMSAQLKLPTDFDATLRLDVFNVFNSKAAVDFQESGDLSNGGVDKTYGLPATYQSPRAVRLQVRVGF